MQRILIYLGLLATALLLTLSPSAYAQQDGPTEHKAPPRSTTRDLDAETHTPKAARDTSEPDHIRGQVTKVEALGIGPVRLQLGDRRLVGTADLFIRRCRTGNRGEREERGEGEE